MVTYMLDIFWNHILQQNRHNISQYWRDSKPGIKTSANDMSSLLGSTSNPDKVVNESPVCNKELPIEMLLQVCIIVTV